MSDRINVIRAPRDSEHAYLAISRALTQDRRLSFEARGVLAYLLSKPSDWIVRIQDLQKEGGCGRDRIYRILKELREAGYLHRDQERQPNGLFIWGPYRVYEQPFTDKADMVAQQQDAAQPFTENTEVEPYTPLPYTVKPYTDNPHVYIEESSTDQRVLQKRERAAPAPAPIAKYTELTGIKPAKFTADMIAEQVTDTNRWERTIKDWLASGFKPANVKGMLDWYHGKGRHQNNGATNRVAPTVGMSSRPPAPADAQPAQQTAAKMQALTYTRLWGRMDFTMTLRIGGDNLRKTRDINSSNHAIM